VSLPSPTAAPQTWLHCCCGRFLILLDLVRDLGGVTFQLPPRGFYHASRTPPGHSAHQRTHTHTHSRNRTAPSAGWCCSCPSIAQVSWRTVAQPDADCRRVLRGCCATMERSWLPHQRPRYLNAAGALLRRALSLAGRAQTHAALMACLACWWLSAPTAAPSSLACGRCACCRARSERELSRGGRRHARTSTPCVRERSPPAG
jgi:hypothetical protein